MTTTDIAQRQSAERRGWIAFVLIISIIVQTHLMLAGAFPFTLSETLAPTGLPLNPFPGAGLLWMPFSLAGSLLFSGQNHGVLNALTVGDWSAIFYGHLAVILLYSLLRRSLSWRIALGLSLALLWLTVAYTYSTALPGVPYVANLFVMTLFVWACARGSRRWSLGWQVAAGLCGGLCILARPENSLSVLLIGVWFGGLWWRLRNPPTGQIVRAGIIIVGLALLGFVLQLVLSPSLASSATVPTPSSGVESGAASLPGILFAPLGGFFAYHPLLILGVLGVLTLLLPRHPRISPRLLWRLLVPCALLFLAQWLIALGGDWQTRAAVGQPGMLPAALVCFAGMAVGWQVIRRWLPLRRVVLVLALLVGVFAVWFSLQLPFLMDLRLQRGGDDLVRSMGMIAANQLEEAVSMRRPCAPNDPMLIRDPFLILPTFSAVTRIPDWDFQTRGSGTFTLEFPVEPIKYYHVGFRLQTPYGADNRLTLTLTDKQTGLEIARQPYDNQIDSYVGVTGYNRQPAPEAPGESVTWVFTADLISRRADMVATIRDIEACQVLIGWISEP